MDEQKGNRSSTDGNPMEMLRRRIRYGRRVAMESATDYDRLCGLSAAVLEGAADRMIETQSLHMKRDVKRVYYLSMEFLMGRLLESNLLALGLGDDMTRALKDLNIDADRLIRQEPDAGLGNGGLGRLAACFLDSLATGEYPAWGYGIRYQHGMFRQEFDNGWQQESPDDWLKYGGLWETIRPDEIVPVLVYGRIENMPVRNNAFRPMWVDWQVIEGVPYDVPVIGHDVGTVNVLRLWSSRAPSDLRLDLFSQGDYIKAVEQKNWAENVSKVLYPSDNTHAGRELRLLQEYFLVACSVRDIVQRFLKNHSDFNRFAERNAIQMNDTHPTLSIVELMRLLLDEHEVPWEKAWDITVRTMGYTNHTLLPEALEKWPVPLMDRLLPRHLQIIYEINHRFLRHVAEVFPGDSGRISRMSLVEEGDVKQVRMANLGIVGSHAVNGVARLHSDLLKSRVVPDFAALWPTHFNNKTNGITHRRWLLQCNPRLAHLITEAIGDHWVKDPARLKDLEKQASDSSFQEAFMKIKRENKQRLAMIIRDRTGLEVSDTALFDVQIKRLHEYKRQLLNAMHIAALYRRIKDHPKKEITPRVFVFGAKAAPSYHMAKRIIKLINNMSEIIHADPDVAGRLRVVFLPDYNVSLAERIVPAADLSEQISAAGTEASGTGNMKLAMNGALTIGTWDGANIEIAEAVGPDNIFIFGHRAEDLERMRGSYRPTAWMENDPELRAVAEAFRDNVFCRTEPGLFGDIYRALTEWGDPYFHMADFRAYADTQGKVGCLFNEAKTWAEKAILNVARMGWFSSDRTIREYAKDIWNLQSCPIPLNRPSKARTSDR